MKSHFKIYLLTAVVCIGCQQAALANQTFEKKVGQYKITECYPVNGNRHTGWEEGHYNFCTKESVKEYEKQAKNPITFNGKYSINTVKHNGIWYLYALDNKAKTVYPMSLAIDPHLGKMTSVKRYFDKNSNRICFIDKTEKTQFIRAIDEEVFKNEVCLRMTKEGDWETSW